MGEVAFSPSFDRFGTGLAASWSGSGIRLLMSIWSWWRARARWNTPLAQAYDLKVFFSIVDADPVDVVAADVLKFISVQRQPRVAGNVIRIEDGESGLSARTIKRRLATLAGLWCRAEHLVGSVGTSRLDLSSNLPSYAWKGAQRCGLLIALARLARRSVLGQQGGVAAVW